MDDVQRTTTRSWALSLEKRENTISSGYESNECVEMKDR
jgi:hypothetical protein